MVLGSPGKKVQRVVELAEDLYERVTAMREQLEATQATLEETRDAVERVEGEVADQRALLEAVAAETGVDVDDVLDGDG